MGQSEHKNETVMEMHQALKQNPENQMEACLHCQTTYSTSQGVGQFCCYGCKAVFQAIRSFGLEDYYKIRNQQSISELKPAQFQKKKHDYLDHPEILKEYRAHSSSSQIRFYIVGIHCAACVWILEKISSLVEGILEVRVDASEKTALVKINENGKFSAFADLAESFGYQVVPLKNGETTFQQKKEERKNELKKIALSAVAAGNIMILSWSNYLGAEPGFVFLFNWISFLLSIPVFLYGAGPFFKNALSSLKARVPTLDLPLSVALLSAFSLSVFQFFSKNEKVYFDSFVVLVFLIHSSRFFVNRFQDHFSGFSETKLSFLPLYAKIKNPSGAWNISPLSQLNQGSVVQVSEDEMIPIDGVVASGLGSVEESVLTGESYPKKVSKGSHVFLGTKLVSGAIEVVSQGKVSESKMIQWMEEAKVDSIQKSKVSRSFEKSSQVFTLFVLGVGFVFWPYLWISFGFHQAFERILSFFMVSCPCVLAFGAPLAYRRVVSKLSNSQIYLKSVDVLEKIKKIENIFFDKTGTLTTADLKNVFQSHPLTKEDQKAFCALEKESHHPIARAILHHFGELGPLPLVNDRKEILGVGVEGKVDRNFYQIQKTSNPPEFQSATPILWASVFKNGEKISDLGFSDEIRLGSMGLVRELRSLGKKLFLVSGDRKENVELLGKALSFSQEELFYEKNPEEKREIVCSKPGNMMVGDGMNDIRALSTADLSIAVGGAAKQSLQMSDVYFGKGEVDHLPKLWVSSKVLDYSLKSIFLFSILYNITTGYFALHGEITPLFAAVLMPLSSILIFGISIFSTREALWKF